MNTSIDFDLTRELNTEHLPEWVNYASVNLTLSDRHDKYSLSIYFNGEMPSETKIDEHDQISKIVENIIFDFADEIDAEYHIDLYGEWDGGRGGTSGPWIDYDIDFNPNRMTISQMSEHLQAFEAFESKYVKELQTN